MENKCKRFLSLLLALVMVIGMMPVGHVHATEVTVNILSKPVTEVKADTEYVLIFGGNRAVHGSTKVNGSFNGLDSGTFTLPNIPGGTGTGNKYIWTLKSVTEDGYRIYNAAAGKYLKIAQNTMSLVDEAEAHIFDFTYHADAGAFAIKARDVEYGYFNKLGTTNIIGGWNGDGTKFVIREVLRDHTHTEQEIPATEATLNSPAMSAGVGCVDCDTVIVAPTQTAPALDYNDGIVPLDAITATAGSIQANNSTEGSADYAKDNNLNSLWHTNYNGSDAADRWIDYGMADKYEVTGLRYKGRNAGINGNITQYKIQVSYNGTDYVDLTTGSWADDATWKEVKFDTPVVVKNVRLLAVASNNNFATAVEMRLTGVKHEHTEQTLPAVAPTFENTGLTEGVQCSVCGEIITAQQTVEALDPYAGIVPTNVLTVTAGDAQSTDEGAEKVLDGDTNSKWHTNWYGSNRDNHWIQFKLSEGYNVDGLRYKPRTDSQLNGTITEYDIQVSHDGEHFTSVKTGTWAGDHNWKEAKFDAQNVEYVRLVSKNAMSDSNYVFASAAEIRLTGVKADHTHAYTAEVTAPTCTADGFTTYTCDCGVSYDANPVETNGHNYGDLIEAQPEVHTTTELKGAVAAHYYCEACSTYFTAEKGETTLEALTSAAPTHNWAAATCTAPKTCSVCQATEGNALDHTAAADDGDCTTPVYCANECGTVMVEAKTHDFDNDCTTADTCKNDGCNVTAAAENAHVFDDDCTTADKCANCGQVAEAAADHAWNDGDQTTAPDCDSEGEMLYTCSACGKTKTESVEALGHRNTETRPAVLPTLTTPGKTAEVYCNDCQQVISGGEEVPALTAKNAKVLNGDIVLTLADCEYVLSGDATNGYILCHGGNYYVMPKGNRSNAKIPQGTTNYGTLTIAAYQNDNNYVTIHGNNGNDQGYLYFHNDATTPTWNRNSTVATQCKIALFCADENSTNAAIPGYTQVAAADIQSGGEYLIAAQHNDGSWYIMVPTDSTTNAAHVAKIVDDAVNHEHQYTTTTTPATCTNTGLITNTCTCGHVHKAIIEINPEAHTWGASQVVTPPTCTEDGYTTYTCECGETKTDNVVSAAHNYGELVAAQPAVHTENELIAAVDAHYYCVACNTYFDADKNETTLDNLTGETPVHIAGEVEIENETEATLNTPDSYDKVVYCTECRKEMSRETVTGSVLEGAVAEVNGTKYATLAEAVAEADSGATVTLLDNVTLSETLVLDKSITIEGGSKTLTTSAAYAVNVTGENIKVTINDLNVVSTASRTGTNTLRGINLVPEATGVELTLSNCSVDFTSESANDWTYAVNCTRNSGNTIVINGGSYEGANPVNIYGNTAVTITSATLTSLYPANESFAGACVKLYDQGSTLTVKNTVFNGDHAVAIDNEMDQSVTAENNTDNTKFYVAKAGGNYYYTLAEAVAAGDSVKLLADTTGAGVVIDKNITIDLGTYTYTFNKGVGSAGTPSNGFQILKNNTVTIKNGTLEIAESAASEFYTVIQNYANLTLTDVTVDATNADKWSTTDGDSYAVSINSGNVNITGNTSIIANDDGNLAYAFDVCKFQSYEAPVVTVAETVTVTGKVDAAAKIGNVYYATFEKALAAGNEITLLKPVTVTADTTYDLTGKTITSEGDVFVVTSGTLTLNGNGTVNAGTDGVGGASAVWANGGHVVINGGTYSVGGDKEYEVSHPDHQNDLIYTKNGGTVVINGGTFMNNGTIWTLNQKDAGAEAGGKITVYGGTFQNWNPADNVAEGAGTSFVADGYCSRGENNTWTVVEGHTWVDATCTTPKTCSVCQETEGEALGHNWVAADCDTPKTCSVCQETEGEALGHTWDNGVVTTLPTAETMGEVTYTCGVCGDTKTGEVAMPAAIVEDVTATTLKAGEYTVPGGKNDKDLTLDLVKKFTAPETAEAVFANWTTDFYITISGLNGEITADDCYLVGNYGDYGWVALPMNGQPITNGTYPVVSTFLQQELTYAEICEDVKEFTAAIHIDAKILADNPDMKVELNLQMTDGNQVLTVGNPVEFVPEVPKAPTATVADLAKEGLTFAKSFKADDATDAQLAYYGDWKADFVLTVNKDVTFGEGNYLAGQFDSFGTEWVQLPLNGTTLTAENPLYIMKAAVEKGADNFNITYNDVVKYVETFNCGVYFTDLLLVENPGLEVTLSLVIYKGNEVITIVDAEKFEAPVVVPDLPTATVTEIENEDLTFALNFLADEASDAQLAYYGDWYADFVLTVNEDVTFNANGGADGYLSGQYDEWSENWVNVPFENVTLKAGDALKIMEYAAKLMGKPDLKLTYNDVYSVVKDFDCGVYFTDLFLVEHPDLEVTLELRMYNNEDETESYTIGQTYIFEDAEVSIDLPTATVTEIENEDLTFALNFLADEASDAQLAYYGDWYADFVLTVNEDVTFNANGGADGYLSGQYDEWSENWVNVPFENVTLKAGDSLKIMEYAAKLMGKPDLKLTYNDVYSVVKDFDCGVYFTDLFLVEHPDLEVTLELRMYNNEDETESYTIGKTYTFEAPVVIPEEPEAIVEDLTGTGLTFAKSFKADDATDAQLAYYGDWKADFVLTVNKDVTFGEGNYLAGQFASFGTDWVQLSLDGTTLTAENPLYIMKAAAENGADDFNITYNDVVEFVKTFNCGVYFTPEFLAANSDLEVTLSLVIYKGNEEITIVDAEKFEAPAVYTWYDEDGTTVLYRVVAAKGETFTAEDYNGDAPTKEGYKFTGWTTSEDGKTFTATYEEIVVETAKVTMNQMQAILEAEILMEYTVEIPQELIDAGAYVVMTKDGRWGEVTKEYKGAELAACLRGNLYAVTIGVASGEMNSGITIQVFDGEGNALNLYNKSGNDLGTSATRTVVDFAKSVLNNQSATAERKALAVALVTYGGYAQKLFNVNADKPAYDLLDELNIAQLDLNAVTAETVAAYKNNQTNTEMGVKARRIEAVLDSYISYRVYLTVEGDIASYRFSVTTPEGVKELTYDYDAQDGYYVEIPDIASGYIDYTYTVTVTNGQDETNEITTSVLSYVRSVLSNSSNTQEKINLAKALYLYNQAADAYFGK